MKNNTIKKSQHAQSTWTRKVFFFEEYKWNKDVIFNGFIKYEEKKKSYDEQFFFWLFLLISQKRYVCVCVCVHKILGNFCCDFLQNAFAIFKPKYVILCDLVQMSLIQFRIISFLVIIQQPQFIAFSLFNRIGHLWLLMANSNQFLREKKKWISIGICMEGNE